MRAARWPCRAEPLARGPDSGPGATAIGSTLQSPIMPNDTPDLVPVRMLNEFVYCPRLFYLEWVQGEWADNYFTEHGRSVHRRADHETAGPPPPDEPRDFVCRSVAASSD